MSEIEHFMTLLMDKEEEGTLSPILAHGGVRFMWIKHNNLYCILLVFYSHILCYLSIPYAHQEPSSNSMNMHVYECRWSKPLM